MIGEKVRGTKSTNVARALQLTLIGFFITVTVFLVALFAAAPEIFVTATGGMPAPILLVPLLVFIAGLVIGVLRRWRWVFWLVLLAFLGSALRLPVTALELLGILPIEPPLWYLLLRAAISVIQLGIGIWMVHMYRRHGVWGERAQLAGRGAEPNA
jgi:hypothetical protein